MGFKFDIG